jgi:DinB superfamily
MTTTAIIQDIEKAFAAFGQTITNMDAQQYGTSPADGKWSPAQHLDHLLRSTRPVVFAINLPAFLLRLFFGKANRPSKTYEELVAGYTGKLASGGRASGRFIPARKGMPSKEAQVAALAHLKRRLQQKATRLTDAKLDQCILPHPLLGKVTIREMLYFTIYHTLHHQRLLTHPPNANS